MGRVHPQHLGRLQEGIGERLAARIVAAGDDGVEAPMQAMSAEVALHIHVRRGRGDGPGQLQLVQEVEQLDHAILQGHAQVARGAEQPRALGLELRHVERRSEMIGEHRTGRRKVQPDHADEEIVRQLHTLLAGGQTHGLARHGLGVDQQAVHVEHHGPHLARQAHVTNSSSW